MSHHPDQRNRYEDQDQSNSLVTPDRFTVARHYVLWAFHSLEVLGSLRCTRKPWKRVGHDFCMRWFGGVFVMSSVEGEQF